MQIIIVGNFTLDFFKDAMQRKIQEATIIIGGYDQFRFELTNPPVEWLQCDYIVICLDWKTIYPELFSFAKGDEVGVILGRFKEYCDEIITLIDIFRKKCTKARILLFTPVWDYYSPFGFIDRMQPIGMNVLTNNADEIINEIIFRNKGIYPVDAELVSKILGKKNVYDPRMNALAGSPFSINFYNEIAAQVRIIIEQTSVYPLKCIVLDCDNTLWGGIIGEDGPYGIVLGMIGVGRSFREFQMEIFRLYRQGIFLSICSKNNEADVIEVLENHSDMILRKDNFASLKINWHPKTDNIQEIASDLNIGLDSILFIDDSPVECELVKSVLPAVTVLQLPSDPAYYKESIYKCSRLKPVLITNDDVSKIQFQINEQQRKQDREKVTDLKQFLRQSKINVIIDTVDVSMMPRVAQLFLKTNQFNLTTKRYTETELNALATDPSNWLGYIKLSDKYGDYGVVGAVLTIGNEIDSFLISCRAFGRDIEQVLLKNAVNRIRQIGYRSVTATFKKTLKNQMVESFYKKNGFKQSEICDECTIWILEDDQYQIETPDWIITKENVNGTTT